MADSIPWDEFEIKYAGLFSSLTGNVASPLRMALGVLIIQTKFQFSNRKLVEQITENPYLQYFVGLPSYREGPPFHASTRVLSRKRITMDMLMTIRFLRLPASPGVAMTQKQNRKTREPLLWTRAVP